MDRNNPYLRIRSADSRQREEIYAEIYDRQADGAEAAPVRSPSRRRRQRLAIYSRIIGPGHGAILEFGCGTGDLTCALADLSQRVVGLDMSGESLAVARRRADTLLGEKAVKIELFKMNAVRPDFPDRSFDYAVSTSMIEHLHPEDVDIHLREVWRVLKPGGRYLVWCPNRLGHHKDRPDHLSMLSFSDLRARMRAAGFEEFSSPLFKKGPLMDTRVKIFMEQTLSRLRIGVLWSHLGVRNVLIVAAKAAAGS